MTDTLPDALIGRDVRIQWRKGVEADWECFRIMEQANGWVRLLGRTDVDKTPWGGPAFWIRVSDIDCVIEEAA